MMSDPPLYQEHQAINEPSLLSAIEKSKHKDRLLSNFDSGDSKTGKYLSYFVGAMWLIPNEQAILISPKIKNLDFLAMFMKCLKYPKVAMGFGSIYSIAVDEPAIKYADNSITREAIDILLLVHFVSLLERLLRRGLKHAWVYQEENLSSRIKGKLLFSPHLKKNLMRGRGDRAYCRFVESDVNCLENRILKKALVIAQRNLKRIDTHVFEPQISYCSGAMQSVSGEVAYHELSRLKINPLYKDYKEALSIAIKIIKRERLKEQDNNSAPPFWIDMALLFEKYVYSLMLDNPSDWEGVEYQFEANKRFLDFLLVGKKMIADTKYKPIYETSFDFADIQQLSAYSRLPKVVDTLKTGDSVIYCLIIYPNQKANNTKFKPDEKTEITFHKTEMPFHHFYKLGVSLPIKSPTK